MLSRVVHKKFYNLRARYFSCFCCYLLIFFNINFFKSSITITVSNCLQRISADDKVTASNDKMKKVNKQCLLDTPRTVRVSEKT